MIDDALQPLVDPKAARPWPVMSADEIAAWEAQKRERDSAKLREMRAAHRRMRLLRELGEEYADATLETHRVEPGNRLAIEMARSVIAGGFHRGCAFHGTVGNGKTRLAACIAHAAISADRGVRFVTMQGLLDEIKAAFDDEGKLAAIYGFAQVDVLVIDDLGKEYATEWAATTRYDVLNARWAAKKPLIVTANRSASEMMALYAPADKAGRIRVDASLGEAVMDRVIAMTGGPSAWVAVSGESQRWSA